MSDTKFTSGKWVFRKSQCTVGVVDKSDTQSYGMLNIVARVDKYDYPENYIENGNLIAASPELYKALDSITGEAAFEGLPETKQDAIYKVLEKSRGEQ